MTTGTKGNGKLMVETLQDSHSIAGTKKWHWYNVQRDLVEQGGLEIEELVINPLSVTDYGCGGEYKENQFYLSWVQDRILVVTSEKHDQTLIDSFSKVVGYKPFARYKESEGSITTEWDRIAPDRRYDELAREGRAGLTRLLE